MLTTSTVTEMPLSFKAPFAMAKRLDALVKKTGRPKSYYLKEAVSEYLDDLEDIYLAEQSLIDIRAGKERTYTAEEVRKELGLAN